MFVLCIIAPGNACVALLKLPVLAKSTKVFVVMLPDIKY